MRTKYSGKKRHRIVTLGCSKNLYDSEVLMGQLNANRLHVQKEDSPEESDVVIINTCGFIRDSKQESIDTILEYVQLKEAGAIEKLIVTGCLSQRYKDELKKEIPDVDAYFGTDDMPALMRMLGADYKKELVGERILTTPSHYAYLKISEGCDRSCSFCAIPSIRGKHRSTPMEDLVTETRKLADQGVKELILIAQDLTYYGLDIYGKRRLAALLEELVKVEGIEWIRLHYLYPTGFPKDIIRVMKEQPKICPYIDMPLQHINSGILRSMNRGHKRKDTEELIAFIRREIPGIALRTTLIAGYPGEGEQEFEELKNWVKEMRFDRLGVFAYSHEENTKAGELVDDVPEEVKQQRVEEIMELQSGISLELNFAKKGKIFDCIIDRIDGDYYVGRTRYDSPEVDNEVLIPVTETRLTPGSIVPVRITGADTYDLFGDLVNR